MIRTRIREDQTLDNDFLSEDEAQERLVFKEGYGTNSTNVVLSDGYFKSSAYYVDGYDQFKSLGANPATPPGSGDTRLFTKSNDIFIIDSLGQVKKLNDQSGASATEGSFTPAVYVGAVSQTATYAIGRYSKFGKATTISLSVQFSKSGTGDLSIQGIPFVANSASNLTQIFVVNMTGVGSSSAYGSGVLYGSGGAGNEVVGRLAPNSSTMFFVKNDTTTNLNDAGLGSSIIVNITGSYLTD